MIDFGRVAPFPKIVFNHAEGAPGPSLLGTGEVGSLITAGCLMSRVWDIRSLPFELSHSRVSPSLGQALNLKSPANPLKTHAKNFFRFCRLFRAPR
jgi:hypothetical protein